MREAGFDVPGLTGLHMVPFRRGAFKKAGDLRKDTVHPAIRFYLGDVTSVAADYLLPD